MSTPQDTIANAAAPASLVGADYIADQVRRLPNKPGVYRMLGARPLGKQRDVLYVGKAKNLKKRVASYTKLSGHSNRIQRMITLTQTMEFAVTETETESLLLEASLIKQLKPKFNVLLRDDKSFPSILIATDHAAPQILKHRGTQKRKGHYFGPFASASCVNDTLNTLQKVFLLRSCTDSVYTARTRPCLLYQIKRCAAPCVDKISQEAYTSLVDEAVAFLQGRNKNLQESLSHDMEQVAASLDFERAAALRDRIRALTFVQQSQDINPATVTDADIFAIHMDGGQACIQSFFFRIGQNWGNHAWFPRHDKDDLPGDILAAFLAQFYDTHTPAKLVLTNIFVPEEALLTKALSIKNNRKITVMTPERGEKLNLINHAYMNAKEALGRRLAETVSQQKLLIALAKVLAMQTPPERIEVYDNSHISGSHAVGGMVVAGPEGFLKKKYRSFNIASTSIQPGDDVGMMAEVLTRRFSRLVKEDTPGSENWPHLVIVDGGQGQLNIAQKAIESTGVETGTDVSSGQVMLMSIAKARREDAQGNKRTDRTAGAIHDQFFIPGRAPFTLEARSPVLYYLQRLRDEAHRFAIGTHQARRKKKFVANPLDDIEGVGTKRKKALLLHFGSAKAVARAKKNDLAAVDGISKAIAERVYDHFHKDT